MSRSIHDNRATYWRAARFDYAEPGARAEYLGGILRRLWRKKVWRFNARREHQATRAGAPAFVSVSPEQEGAALTMRRLRTIRSVSESPNSATRPA